MRLEVAAPSIFLVGENGQGKSNFLESIYLLCFASSFRTRRDVEMIRSGSKSASAAGSFARPDDGSGYEHQVGVQLTGGNKEIHLNGKRLWDRRELIEHNPCVAFTHTDISLADGPPQPLRRFFDQTLSLFDPSFVDVLRAYNRVLISRNTALRQHDAMLLDAYDPQLARHGIEIQHRRQQTMERFDDTFAGLFAEIYGSGVTATIRYHPSWHGCETIADALTHLATRRHRDQELAFSTSGPHRDRFLFQLDGREFRSHASTGQRRLASLVLKVAQATYFVTMTGRHPILILDDVLLELDGSRRERFMRLLPPGRQMFLAFLPEEAFARYQTADTLLFRVERGTIMPWNSPATF